MRINKSSPIEIQNRLFINTEKNITYLIGEKGSGKSSETARQAAINEAFILSPTKFPYKNYGIPHAEKDNLQELGVKYVTLSDLLQGKIYEFPMKADGYVHFCVDEARIMLQEMLSMAFDEPIKIDFMTMDTGDLDEEV